MLHALLLALLCCCGIPFAEASVRACDPSNYICWGKCPAVPPGLVLRPDEPACMLNTDQDACICWLRQSRSSQLDSVFACEARVNGSASKIYCAPPSQCFPPDVSPSCLIIRNCKCIPYSASGTVPRLYGAWSPVLARVTTIERPGGRGGSEGTAVEKYPGDVREFSLKHLLFLLGFVIAPLLCWCLLNFLHEGKCRKKPPPQPPPEALPINTSRSATVDDMNNEVDATPSAPPLSVDRSTVAVDLGAVDQRAKCESPPPYEESEAQCFSPEECGPPPSYDDAMVGASLEIRRWHQPPVLIVHDGPTTRQSTS